MLDWLRLAVGTFTAVPVRPPATVGRSTARWAMLLAPIGSLPLGVVAAAVGLGGTRIGLPLPLVAVLTVGAVAWSSRGLHLDGLADCADGLSASWDRERALEIMRRGDIGPSGIAALVFVVLAQIAAVWAILGHPRGWLCIALLVVVSRGTAAFACLSGVPAARPGGLGAAVAGSVPAGLAAIAGIGGAGVVAGALMLRGGSWWQGVLATTLAYLAVGVWLRHCMRRFGGITGDVIGATIEIAATVLLAAAAAG